MTIDRTALKNKRKKIRFVPPAITPIQVEDILNGLFSSCSKKNIVKEFERHFAKRYNLITAKSYNSWLGGLIDIFKMLSEISSSGKREVVLPAFSCPTYSLAIKEAGLVPVYCDVELKNLSIDLKSLESKMDKDTLVVLPVNIVGFPNPIYDIIDIAKSYNAYVIEDGTYALGTVYKNNLVGSTGDFSIFSFAEGKAIPVGGGMVGINDSELANRFSTKRMGSRYGFLQVLKILGYSIIAHPFVFTIISSFFKKDSGIAISHTPLTLELSNRIMIKRGKNMSYNYNVDNIKRSVSRFQAGVGISLLNSLDANIEIRARNAEYLKNKLKKIDWIELPEPLPGTNKMHYIRFPIFVNSEKRERVYQKLTSLGIGATKMYFGECDEQVDRFENPSSYYVNQSILTLPVHPYVMKKDLDLIFDAMYSLEDNGLEASQ